MHNLKHNKVLHETNLFVHVQHHEVPWIGFDKRCEIEPSATTAGRSRCTRLQERPRRARGLGLLRGRGVQLDEMDTSYFLSRDIVIPTLGEKAWRCGARSRRHAPQRVGGSRLPEPADQPGRRARLEGRDLSRHAPARADWRGWLPATSVSAAVAGFVAVLVGFTSSVAIVFRPRPPSARHRSSWPRGCGRSASHGGCARSSPSLCCASR